MADVSQIKLPNGSVYDLIDEKSGYITAEYIENKTDYSIPVSRAGAIVAGETAIGTDSTNFPTSKAVVDYVDERVVQEIEAIDVGVTGIKANGTSLAIENGVINIPIVGPNQAVGLMTDEYMGNIYDQIDGVYDYIDSVSNSIPTSTSQLTNDSGFITGYTDEQVKQISISSNDSNHIPVLLASGVSGATNTHYVYKHTGFYYQASTGTLGGVNKIGNITLPNATGTLALTSDIPTVPTNISSFTNDSGYLTSSDIASVLTYKGTKASYSALPSSGNSTGDVWHVTDTGAEYAWDGSAWQELGTAIDLSNYATKATTLSGYGITDAKIQNGTITLGSNTITPLTSFTETDPVFSASAAAGITATDISNWNAKVSDDKTWNGVSLSKSTTSSASSYYLPSLSSTSGTTAYLYQATNTPTNNAIAKYDGSAYLKSTTPSANDNSTKVATTAYVDAAIPDTSNFLTLATLPIYDGTVE